MPRRRRTRLPAELRSLFWEHDFDRLSVEEDGHMIIYRLVEWGTPSAIAWLRATYGDDAIYDAIARIRSRGLAYKKVQRWVLRAEYARWAAERPPSLWEGR